MNPKVSIIIPIYNIIDYVERCVESIIKQSYQNLEIILVDDGSTDGSSDKIRKYSDDERVMIISKINGGLSDARNAGLEISSGDYVMYVDGDDYLDEDCVQILISLIDDNTDVIMFPYSKEYGNRSEKCELFETQEIVFNDDDVKRNIYARLVGPEMSITSISPVTMDRLNTAWGKLYKSKVINGIRFTDTSLIGPEDCWYNIQVFKNVKRVKYTSNTYYKYEKRNISSLCHKYDNKLLEKRWYFYDLLSDFLSADKTEYEKNLSNRIICELYGLIQNVLNSDLSKGMKKKEINRILNDKRYEKHYSIVQISQYEFPWSFFYLMMKYKSISGVCMFFSIIKFREQINESRFYNTFFRKVQ